MKFYSTKEIADEFNCARITVIKWCESNDVSYTGGGNRKTYIFTDEDKEKFKSRNTVVGRPSKSQ